MNALRGATATTSSTGGQTVTPIPGKFHMSTSIPAKASAPPTPHGSLLGALLESPPPPNDDLRPATEEPHQVTPQAGAPGDQHVETGVRVEPSKTFQSMMNHLSHRLSTHQSARGNPERRPPQHPAGYTGEGARDAELVVTNITVPNEAAIVALRNAVWYDSLFRDDITLHAPSTLGDALHRASRYIELEEENLILSRKHNPVKAAPTKDIITIKTNTDENLVPSNTLTRT
ncbi:unnamed protein product [Arabidopsis thaliana]|uniref:(thale cress) hypothetical protein n=1 Tax=Arabidopsis thaliana TaxID=3702 RepID=A0A7G2FFK3_ARATH|nr:unnamed protein product [Arabidopsis thaliana]